MEVKKPFFVDTYNVKSGIETKYFDNKKDAIKYAKQQWSNKQLSIYKIKVWHYYRVQNVDKHDNLIYKLD